MWFIKHTKTGEILNIKDEKTTVGRLGTTYILKNDESISRKHCTFLLQQNELKVIDDGAKYGTTVNVKGNKVSKNPMQLKNGDKIHFGCFENIWEIHFKAEVIANSKRKLDEDESMNENSSSISNVSKKVKDNLINSKVAEKFDVVIESSDDEIPVSHSGRSFRPRRNLIKDSQDIQPSTSKEPAVEKKKELQKVTQNPANSLLNNSKEPTVDKIKEPVTKKLTQNPAISLPSQAFLDLDSDEDIFATASEKADSNAIIDEDLFNFDTPSTRVNPLKRPSNETEESGNSKKNFKPKHLATKAVSKITSETYDSNKVVTSTQKSTKNQTSSDNIDGSINKGSTLLSQISRKRDPDDDNFFDFDIPTSRHQLKRPKRANNEENESSEPIPSTSTESSSKVQPFAFKTKNLCNKEIFASFEYDVDDSGEWLSTKVSNMNIKVKDEPHHDTDNSIASSLEPPSNYTIKIKQKSVNLDTSTESTKSFKKQKFQESNQAVGLKKVNVRDMNSLISMDESRISCT